PAHVEVERAAGVAHERERQVERQSRMQPHDLRDVEERAAAAVQQDDGRVGTVVHDRVDDIGGGRRRQPRLAEQRVEKDDEPTLRRGLDRLERRRAERIEPVQPRMQLDAAEPLRRKPLELPSGRRAPDARGIEAGDRHEAIARGRGAFEHVLVVDDAGEPDEARAVDAAAIELGHQAREARVVAAVDPAAVARDVHEGVETLHAGGGSWTALPMAVLPASRFTANSSIQRPANVVHRIGASGSIGSTPWGHDALKYTTSPGSATSSITRSRPSAIWTKRPPL